MLDDVRKELRSHSDPKQARLLQRFFKTGKGEYADGDRFIGVMVPTSRAVAKRFCTLPLPDVIRLLKSPIHEERFVALILLVARYQSGDAAMRTKIMQQYLKHARYVNNWDLVDVSAVKIVGPTATTALLDRLVRSSLVWERRIAVLACFHDVGKGDAKKALRVAKQLLHDDHDLIHKAVGWMLREVGKRCSERELKSFLDKHAQEMPRTMLRYAIEKLPPSERKRYLAS